ncbi:MAG: hypothetical protein JWQ97_969 [Phenylobacterium sp.]|nr:hypothetical protein [Phenylobacterium sp.]
MIYFVKDTLSGFIKIGFSDNPGLRLVKMQADCPGELVLQGMCEGDRAAEAALHRRYAHLHQRGEWFRPDAELAAHVEAVAVAPREGTAANPNIERRRQLCEATGAPYNTVELWFVRGRIPAWAWLPIANAGLATLEDLAHAAQEKLRPATLAPVAA